MNKFKMASPFLAGALLFTSISVPASAQSPAVPTASEQAQSFSNLIVSNTDDSITFTDGSTLTQHDGYYVSTDANGEQFKITPAADDKVKYENIKTGEANYATMQSAPVREEQGLSANAQTAADGFVYKGMVKNSTSIVVGNIATVAGILASFIFKGTAGKISSVITGLAADLVASSSLQAFWIEKSYTKSKQTSEAHATLTIRKDFHYYKDSDYTSFMNTVSTIQVCQPYGCGPVEYVN